ncbi:hypothetical protein CGI15_00720 [Vibrio parahaemolyticus]|nr:hypothetical protein CGI15_00720 [Vibrio parahaemolyticus]TOR04861.1 hypothetical protein CGG81_18350 [Vibrio parahaemolyticus]
MGYKEQRAKSNKREHWSVLLFLYIHIFDGLLAIKCIDFIDREFLLEIRMIRRMMAAFGE